MRVLDLGTGSGAIALAIARERPRAAVVATDVSAPALAGRARECAACRRLQRGSSSSPTGTATSVWWRRPRRSTLIVSNPPLRRRRAIRISRRATSASSPSGADVRCRRARRAAHDHRRRAARVFRPARLLALEHGYDQACPVRELIARRGIRRARVGARPLRDPSRRARTPSLSRASARRISSPPVAFGRQPRPPFGGAGALPAPGVAVALTGRRPDCRRQPASEPSHARTRRHLLPRLSFVCAVAPSRRHKKPRIEKAADLPRFSYPLEGKRRRDVIGRCEVSAFREAVRRDTQSVLSGYEIDDRATLRQLEGELALLDYLEGDDQSALAPPSVRELQDKPADKLMSGLQLRAMIAAERKVGDRASEAYRGEDGPADRRRARADALRRRAERGQGGEGAGRDRSEALTLGYVRNVIQPTVDKAGALRSDLAPAVINAKYRLSRCCRSRRRWSKPTAAISPRTRSTSRTSGRRATSSCPPGKGYSTVNVGIWDSGVDTALFGKRVVKDDDGKPAVIAFDRFANPATGELQPIPGELKDQGPADEGAPQGLLRPAVEHRQPGGERGEAVPVDAEARRVQGARSRSSISPATGCTARTWPGSHRRQSVRAARRRPDRVRLASAARSLSDERARAARREEPAGVRRFLQAARRARGQHELGRHRSRARRSSSSSATSASTPDERKEIARDYFDIQKEALDKGVRERAGHPVRHGRRKQQRERVVRRGHSRRASRRPT